MKRRLKSILTWPRITIAAILVLIASSGVAQAPVGWVGVTNDSGVTVGLVDATTGSGKLILTDANGQNAIILDSGFATSSITGSLKLGQTWNDRGLELGNYRLWVDRTGKLRIKQGAPAHDTDGSIV